MKMRVIGFLMAILLVFTLAIPALAENTNRLIDDADLLSSDEETQLLSHLNRVSNTYQVDFVIVIQQTISDMRIEAYAGQFYDQNQYGFGDDKDGVLLVVAMEEREYFVFTNGFGFQAITDMEAESIGDSLSYYLTDGDYVNAFKTFIDECEYEINGEINGFPFAFGANLCISLVIGFVIALIVTGIWRGQLKSVRQQKNANSYTKTGSKQITLSNDLFLYSTVTRTPKPQNNGNGGSRGISSGGSSRGGAGGSF